jgi:hypothetical protein
MNNNSNNQKTYGPPYLLGLLGLIPIVGGCVGVGLLLYGLIRYKDKWLSIIGAVSILITIVYHFAFLYQNEYSLKHKKIIEHISQKDLNQLVKDVEFFKLQYGKYPDSLDEMLTKQYGVIVTDIIQILQKRSNIDFYYQKVGEKYMLFSLGEDGLPNTKDDIYPKMAISDSTKIGLILPNNK